MVSNVSNGFVLGVSKKIMKNKGLTRTKYRPTTRLASKKKAAKRMNLNRKIHSRKFSSSASGAYSGEGTVTTRVLRSRKLHQ